MKENTIFISTYSRVKFPKAGNALEKASGVNVLKNIDGP